MTVPAPILARWSRFTNARVRAFGTGLINKTFLVETDDASDASSDRDRAVFQRLHPVFDGVVNEDIDAVTSHLARKGMPTPRLLRTDDGAAFVEDAESGRPWRALSYVRGASFDTVADARVAFEAGALVARFHEALSDLTYRYRHVRAGVHDTGKHLAVLARTLEEHGGHRLFADTAPLARDILAAGATLADLSAAPLRHGHGDLKISNLLFDDAGRGLCLVDLDTLGLMPLAHELGDALRSWTNRAGEDVLDAQVDVDVFAGAVAGYASGARARMSALEQGLIVEGMRTICVELAARFCADALNESYFGWNEARYDSRGAHNLVRARGQFALARSVEQQRAALNAAVRRAFD